ncbi:MAG: GIY-YIG nuclease family protein [Bacillota bacterium]
MKEYTMMQRARFPTKMKYIFSFIGGSGTTAILDAVYISNGLCTENPKFSAEYRSFMPNSFGTENIVLDLVECELLAEYKSKLVIDWGNATRSWYQYGNKEKQILAIYPQYIKSFCGFENLILTFNELKAIIDDKILYHDYHVALKSVFAIYAITNRNTGKIYIGSSYGSDGLLGRWKEYVSSHHGGNKKLKEVLAIKSTEFEAFQFSILQVLSKSLSADEVIAIETSYKNKLLTVEFGLNAN